MRTAVRPAKTSPGPWDAFADVDVFVGFCQGSRQRGRNEQFRHASEPWHSQNLLR
jgi:hypothetical protein